MLPTLSQIESAQQSIAGAAIRTPLLRLNVDDAPAEIYLKLENLQPIGSFKIRGAANAIAQLSPEQLQQGVFTASAGNMARGAAWMARRLGVPCTVIAPDTAPATKIQAIERLGGRVIKVPFERWWQTFQGRAYPGLAGAFIHAFDDPAVMAGNGTIGLEILEDLPDVDAVVMGWGGGGLTWKSSHIRTRSLACRRRAAVAGPRGRGRGRGARRTRARADDDRGPTTARALGERSASRRRRSRRRCSRSKPKAPCCAGGSRRGCRPMRWRWCDRRLLARIHRFARSIACARRSSRSARRISCASCSRGNTSTRRAS